MILKVENVSLKYGNKEVVKNLNMNIKKGEIVTIVGPNGSGKSTILKSLSRYLKPDTGKILLNDKDINKIGNKIVAKKVAILPQIRNVPSDFTVETLVGYGRYPHLDFGNRLKKNDYEIINWAMKKTGMSNFKTRRLNTLSGGERQRAWLAMSLAQRPDILILDEPTTFLDVSYQLEILELIKKLNEDLNLTIIMVLHDLNQALRFSHKIVAIKNGEIYSYGDGEKIINKDLLRNVFRIEADMFKDKINDCYYMLPQRVTS